MKSIFTLVLVAFAGSLMSQTITGTEAVEYDPTQNRFIISNGSSILQQPSGSSQLSFFGSEDADYGMEVVDDKLFTVSGGFTQSIKAFDLATEELLGQTSIPGSQFLNGMGSDPATNRIWVTDFNDNAIHEIDVTDPANMQVTEVVSNTGCTPNGITYDPANNRLCYVCWSGGSIYEVDLTDYSVSELVNSNLNNMDGIDHDEEGYFYVSSWNPTQITEFSSDFTVQETVTAPGLANPADISYAVGIDTLAIANSGNQTITYIHLEEPVGLSEFNALNEGLDIYPNPIQQSGYAAFELPTAMNCTLTILDANGRLVRQLYSGHLPAGKQKVTFQKEDLAEGNYLLVLNAGGKQSTQKLVIMP